MYITSFKPFHQLEIAIYESNLYEIINIIGENLYLKKDKQKSWKFISQKSILILCHSKRQQKHLTAISVDHIIILKIIYGNLCQMCSTSCLFNLISLYYRWNCLLCPPQCRWALLHAGKRRKETKLMREI